MYVDEALNIVLKDLNKILIPSSEAEGMAKVKTNIREVIVAVQRDRTSNKNTEGSDLNENRNK